MIILEDDLGQSVQIKNLKRFCCHIKEFHSVGTSIYKERGHSFTVDDDFRYRLRQQALYIGRKIQRSNAQDDKFI